MDFLANSYTVKRSGSPTRPIPPCSSNPTIRQCVHRRHQHLHPKIISCSQIFFEARLHIPYPFEQVQPTRYKFFSVGRNRIEKIVDFVPLKAINVMNLGFGDLLAFGSIDDKIASNNGDIRKVLATQP